ncbi:hypothetical protein ACFQU2_26725 [Siccirubricoccus deserti]
MRQRQQEGFQRTARELEQGLMQVAAGQAVAGLRGQADLGGAVNAGQALAATLRQTRAAGRMVVEANPVVLAGRPDLDVLMEPGDLVAMPKRPNEVTVVGAVLNPGSLVATGWKAAEYVRAAGGEQRFADGGRAFVVLPNGQSAPAGLGAWQAGGPPIPPGSVVVVPQDPHPTKAGACCATSPRCCRRSPSPAPPWPSSCGRVGGRLRSKTRRAPPPRPLAKGQKALGVHDLPLPGGPPKGSSGQR